jgi:hypothetical protein
LKKEERTMNISMKRTSVAFLLTLTMALFLVETTEAGSPRKRSKEGAQKLTLRERREARRDETPEEKKERRARFWGAVAKGLSNAADSSSFDSWNSSSSFSSSSSPEINFRQMEWNSFNRNYSRNPDHASVYGN